MLTGAQHTWIVRKGGLRGLIRGREWGEGEAAQENNDVNRKWSLPPARASFSFSSRHVLMTAPPLILICGHITQGHRFPFEQRS